MRAPFPKVDALRTDKHRAPVRVRIQEETGDRAGTRSVNVNVSAPFKMFVLSLFAFPALPALA